MEAELASERLFLFIKKLVMEKNQMCGTLVTPLLKIFRLTKMSSNLPSDDQNSIQSWEGLKWESCKMETLI
jgi:hypothetical protein